MLYEGYLLYPYRANSRKNQTRWQFGVLGPAGAADAGIGEDDSLSAQVLVAPRRTDAATVVSVVVRFLQLQHRGVEKDAGGGRFEPVEELVSDVAILAALGRGRGARDLVRAARHRIRTAADGFRSRSARAPISRSCRGGRLVRTRRALHAVLEITAEHDDGLVRLTMTVRNSAPPARRQRRGDRRVADRHPPRRGDHRRRLRVAPGSAGIGRQRRRPMPAPPLFPVLAGPPGDQTLVLVSPIILYDHPEIAEQSEGALYDSTEIDEILTLRIMTMTDEEKAVARATDPLAAQIIDRCDSMSPEAMLNLHGVLRDPHAADDTAGLIPEIPEGVDWWDPMADNAVQPGIDAVLVNGVRVSRNSRVRLHPSRRADAQDLFFADKIARVTSVHETVDGDVHVGVVIEDDPAADLHDWYGRYLYFAPDEVEPLSERNPTWM